MFKVSLLRLIAGILLSFLTGIGVQRLLFSPLPLPPQGEHITVCEETRHWTLDDVRVYRARLCYFTPLPAAQAQVWIDAQPDWPLSFLPGYPEWRFGPAHMALRRTVKLPGFRRTNGGEPPPVWYTWSKRGTVIIIDTELVLGW
jgi:hypothetical protein